jgi:hypothetical protein
MFKDVAGFEGLYEVGEDGLVISKERIVKRGKFSLKIPRKVISVSRSTCGRPVVQLWRNNQRSLRTIHSIVAETFIGKRPLGMEVCHNDGDGDNNHFSNLRYGTHKENMGDMVRHGTSLRGEKQWNSKLTEKDVVDILSIRNISKDNKKIIAKKYNVHKFTIDKILRRERWGWVKI